MDDAAIVSLYWARSEDAISQTAATAMVCRPIEPEDKRTEDYITGRFG